MTLRRTWGAIAGSVLIAGALLTGAAYAANPGPGPGPDRPLKTEALSAGEKKVRQQIKDLRRSYMEKFRTEAGALIDEAVKQGTITQEQAEKLKARHERHAHDKKLRRMSQDELKQKLDEAVQSGRMTPEQAARILEKHASH